MKKYIFLLISIICWECVPTKKNEAMDAYNQLKKYNMLPLLNFVIDTRGNNNSGQLIVRSIRFFENSGESYLIFPKMDSIDLNKFSNKQNFKISQIDSIVDILLKHQARANASEISSIPKLGEFVYYSFQNDNKVLVYCPDISKIYNNYWKIYINNGKKLDTSWYIVMK